MHPYPHLPPTHPPPNNNTHAGMKSGFATRMAGSSDLYARNARKPCHSINFVTAHDGFSLHDLVSYNSKHNEVRSACVCTDA